MLVFKMFAVTLLAVGPGVTVTHTVIPPSHCDIVYTDQDKFTYAKIATALPGSAASRYPGYGTALLDLRYALASFKEAPLTRKSGHALERAYRELSLAKQSIDKIVGVKVARLYDNLTPCVERSKNAGIYGRTFLLSASWSLTNKSTDRIEDGLRKTAKAHVDAARDILAKTIP